MPGFMDPYAVMATNPYLSLPQPEKPHWTQTVGTMLTGLGTGISGASGAGRPWHAGIGPGAAMATSALANQRQQQEAEAIKRWQLGMMAQKYQDQRNEQARKEAAIAAAAEEFAPGLRVPTAPAVQMGPDLKQAGAPLVDYLTTRHGFSPVAAASTVGNLYQESRFNPTAVGDGGRSTGMAQWDPNRYAGLVQFAQTQGRPPNDPNTQLDYLVSEMKGGDMGAQRAYALLQTAKTPEEGTAALMHFFRPAGYTPANPAGGHAFGNRVQYAQALLPNGQPVPQGEGGPSGSPAGPGGSMSVSDAPKLVLPPKPVLPPEEAVRIRKAILDGSMTPTQGRTEAARIVNDLWSVQRAEAQSRYQQESENYRFNRGQSAKDAWEPLSEQNARMMLGPAYDGKPMQRNKVTGEIKPVGGAQTTVNVDTKGEAEFSKQMGKMDAERYGKIIEAESTMSDMASKLGYAMDQFRQTYTGPGAETANYLNRILGAAGFEEAGKKANAADAAMAAVSQVKPHMRATGSGASSDKDMDMFARALPNLINLPGGNERIVAYFQKLSDRATAIRQLAQEHSEGGRVPLTRTGFDDAVKKLGPLFSEEERKELSDLGKRKADSAKDRPPLDSFSRTPQMTPAPQGSIAPRPPLSSFGGR